MKVGDMVTTKSLYAIGIIIDSRVASSATSENRANCVNSHQVYWSVPTNVKKNPVWIMARDLVKVV
jgi:translation initiation factor IF-1